MSRRGWINLRHLLPTKDSPIICATSNSCRLPHLEVRREAAAVCICPWPYHPACVDSETVLEGYVGHVENVAVHQYPTYGIREGVKLQCIKQMSSKQMTKTTSANSHACLIQTQCRAVHPERSMPPNKDPPILEEPCHPIKPCPPWNTANCCLDTQFASTLCGGFLGCTKST